MAEIGIEKLLLLNGDKLGALLDGRSRADMSFPVTLSLSLTDKCQMKCLWCCDLDFRNDHKGWLKLEVIDRMFAEAAAGGTSGVTIEGGGEPTIHPKFLEIVDSGKKHGLKLGLFTNGLHQNTHLRAESFDWIRVSLDATTDEEFVSSKLMKKGTFEKVIENIAKLVGRCPVVGVSFVVASHNIAGAVTVTERLRDLGVSYVQFRVAHEYEPDKSGVHLPEAELSALARPGFGVIMDGMRDNLVSGNAGVPCVAHSVSVVIAPNGDLYLCGRLYLDKEWPPLGNLYEESFTDIWLGKERRRQAQLMRDVAVCKKSCPPCRLTKFNVLLDGAATAKTVGFI